MRAFDGAANLGPSAESLSAQLLNQRMMVASQEVANKAAISAPAASTAPNGLQEGVTSDTFDNLIGNSKLFQQHRDEINTNIEKIKWRAGHEYQGHHKYAVPARRRCSLASTHRKLHHGQDWSAGFRASF